MLDKIEERAGWIERHVLPYEPRIRAWLNRNRVADLEVDDIVQEMYARIGALDSFDGIRRPELYALKVAHSILFNHIHRSRIVRITAAGDLRAYDTPSLEASPEETAAQRDEVQIVADMLAAMPERTRQVLLLRRVEGLSQRETAVRLAIAEKTVEKHMTRAVLYLSEHFGRGAKARVNTVSGTVEPSDDADDCSE